MSDGCHAVLAALRRYDWAASSLILADVNPLNYRARISDLRSLFHLEIIADSHRDETTGKVHTVYRVPPHARARANWLWQHRTLEGFVSRPATRSLFA